MTRPGKKQAPRRRTKMKTIKPKPQTNLKAGKHKPQKHVKVKIGTHKLKLQAKSRTHKPQKQANMNAGTHKPKLQAKLKAVKPKPQVRLNAKEPKPQLRVKSAENQEGLIQAGGRTTPKLNTHLRLEKVGADFVAYDPEHKTAFKLDPLAFFICTLCDGSNSTGQIAHKLESVLRENNLAPPVKNLENEVETVINTLSQNGVVFVD